MISVWFLKNSRNLNWLLSFFNWNFSVKFYRVFCSLLLNKWHKNRFLWMNVFWNNLSDIWISLTRKPSVSNEKESLSVSSLKKKKKKGLWWQKYPRHTTEHRYRRLRVKFFNTYYIHACFWLRKKKWMTKRSLH